jgi:hypothetical protein
MEIQIPMEEEPGRDIIPLLQIPILMVEEREKVAVALLILIQTLTTEEQEPILPAPLLHPTTMRGQEMVETIAAMIIILTRTIPPVSLPG